MTSTHNSDDSSSRTLQLTSLRWTASWIRDDLDPLVARDGANVLHPDDVLMLHSLLLDLQKHPLSVHVLRFSRIFLAVREMCGKATRWPGKLVDEADQLIEQWEARYGPLRNIRTPLYEEGGRLFGVCDANDVDRQDIVKCFAAQSPKNIDNQHAYIHGNLGFKPGKWWINGLFAFRDGIINSMCTDGGIVYTPNGVYAIVMRGGEEVNAACPSAFTYRCRLNDAGRFRLISANFQARGVVRILRDHRMVSPWAPRTGIRYDGLYKVTGWTMEPVNPEKNGGQYVRFNVHFESVEVYVNWDKVLRVPTAEETDDYKMYKIIHREQREYQRRGAREESGATSLSLPQADSQLRIGTALRLLSLDHSIPNSGQARRHSGTAEKHVNFENSTSTTPNPSSSSPSLESKTPVDGSSDYDLPSVTLARSRRPAYSTDHFASISEHMVDTAQTRHEDQIAMGISKIEPFSSLRRKHIGADGRRVDSLIHFQPVNWNPGARSDLAPAFSLSEEMLHKIAPFSDLRKRASMETNLSPKTSVHGLHNLLPHARSVRCEPLYEAGAVSARENDGRDVDGEVNAGARRID